MYLLSQIFLTNSLANFSETFNIVIFNHYFINTYIMLSYLNYDSWDTI